MKFKEALPHWYFFNGVESDDEPLVADQQLADWLEEDCLYSIIDGFHRKAVS
jgi:hypothetical protein